MLIFILYANKIGIENYQQHSKPHRLQNMGCTRIEIHQQNAEIQAVTLIGEGAAWLRGAEWKSKSE